jgi:SHS2 domain-containing protein
VEWLNRLLAEKDIKNMAFSKFKVKIKDNKLTGFAWGEKFDPEKHQSELEVKAATYSQLKVEKQKNKWLAQCIVDV